MAEDPYKTLGVAKDASAEDIHKAYRKLAKKHHPDMNPGNKAAEERFKAVSAANELISDPDKRARYDRGEIDAGGAEKAPPRYRQHAGAAPGQRPGAQGFGTEEGFEDIFSTIFQNGAGRPGSTQPSRGRDAQYVLAAEFIDTINGGAKRLNLPDGQVLDVKIPPGTDDGDVLRLRGRGEPGRNSGPMGDALIEIKVLPHKFFKRDGQDIRFELPVSVPEAVLGGKVTVPTPGGPVTMTIKPNSDSGAELRLRGRGVPAHGSQPAGDLYVKLRVVIGPTDEKLQNFLRDWQPKPPIDPRRDM